MWYSGLSHMMLNDIQNATALRQFRSQHSYSYILFDPKRFKAVILDPTIEHLEDYRNFLAEQNLQLISILEIYPSPVSGAEILQVETGAKIKILHQNQTALQKLETGSNLFRNAIFAGNTFEIGVPSDPSIREFLNQKPDSTLIFPGHTESEILFSTVETEKAPKEPEKGTSISVEKYKHKLHEKNSNSIFIDVREEQEYQLGHIPGTQNVPFSEIALHWEKLRPYPKIFVSCLTGRRSAQVVKTLTYLGHSGIVHVSGGIHAWANAGYSLELSTKS